ncbi:MAG: helix-turn-helix domain-containing protein, partial [Cupriavidus sp.]|nr:helix-turn-helix domain-containing protein [Cupriavidus sp.]
GLLEVMLMSRDRVVTKRQLVERLCAADREISINAIEVYMHRLRKKLEGEGVRIRTVPGIGYCLERPTETPDAVRHPQTALIPVYSDNKMEKSHQ